jgi:single-strand DNA-binding protein
MSINKVILIGNLGKDPVVRATTTGNNVATLSLATNERRKNTNGVWEEQTEWHKVVAFGKLADLTQKFLSKGRKVYVEGKLRTNKWQDKQGTDHYTTEILADTLQFLDGKREDTVAVPAQATTVSDVQPLTYEEDDISFG